MFPKTTKRFLIILLPFVLLVCNSKSVNIKKDEEVFIKAFAQEWKVDLPIDSIHSSFETEVRFINAAQKAVIFNVAHEEIAQSKFGDLSYYYKNRKGLCYDRAVLMEKFFSFYGFDFRHIYLFFGDNNKTPSFTSLFKKGLASHALLEVKTKKGWMAIGTNADWIGLTQDNNVMSVPLIRQKLQTGKLNLKEYATRGNVFWKVKKQNFQFIYGLYSRHGDFFTSSSMMSFFHILPDYNLRMLLYNFY